MRSIKFLLFISIVKSISLTLLIGCNSSSETSNSKRSAEYLTKFLVTGDTTLLREVLADTVLDEMSISDMIETRADLQSRFGILKSVDEAIFITDSTAEVTMNYEQLSFVATLTFDIEGKISFISLRPAPVEGDTKVDDHSGLTDIESFDDLQKIFNSNSNFVRLVSILSPT